MSEASIAIAVALRKWRSTRLSGPLSVISLSYHYRSSSANCASPR
jgi:hypothetical protein